MGLDISQCLNPDCLQQNPPQLFCQRCGSKLLLADRYRATRLLGQGGMGRTWEAIDLHRLDTPCVIKQFLPLQQGKAAIEKATQLFRQEAMRLRDLGKHPQIPDLLAFIEQEGKLYLVQEFIEGKTLLQEMEENGRFSEERVRKVLHDLLPVLDFVHQRQVIHRDIKPDNIMRSPSGQLVLIDFGVSKQTSSSLLSQVGTVTGTPGYAPIEQTRGIVYPASDLYSLGVTCIRLLTGCLPTDKNGSLADELFDSRKWRWVWREQLQKQGKTISPVLDGVLDKLLQDLPEARYQSAAEVMAALDFEEREAQLQQQEKRQLEVALRQECDRLRNQLKESERARLNLEGRLEAQNRQRQDWRNRLEEQKYQLEIETRRCLELQSHIEDLQGNIEEQKSQLEVETSQRQDLQIQLDRQKSQLEKETRDRQDLQIQLERKTRDRQDLQGRLERQQSPLEMEKRQRQDVQSRLARAETQTNPGLLGWLFGQGIDYTRLRDLLAAGEWQEADLETGNRMLEAMGKNKWPDVQKKDIDNFPCKDLATIDSLWVNYSNGHFGFSVQKRIYDRMGASLNPVMEDLGDRLGWVKGRFLTRRVLNSSELTFDLTAPPGHLPIVCGARVWSSGLPVFWLLLSERLVACRIV